MVSGSTKPALHNRNIRNVIVKNGLIKNPRILGSETKESRTHTAPGHRPEVTNEGVKRVITEVVLRLRWRMLRESNANVLVLVRGGRLPESELATPNFIGRIYKLKI